MEKVLDLVFAREGNTWKATWAEDFYVPTLNHPDLSDDARAMYFRAMESCWNHE